MEEPKGESKSVEEREEDKLLEDDVEGVGDEPIDVPVPEDLLDLDLEDEEDNDDSNKQSKLAPPTKAEGSSAETPAAPSLMEIVTLMTTFL